MPLYMYIFPVTSIAVFLYCMTAFSLECQGALSFSEQQITHNLHINKRLSVRFEINLGCHFVAIKKPCAPMSGVVCAVLVLLLKRM